MQPIATALTFAIGISLGLSDAKAMTVVAPPPPNIRITIEVTANQLNDMKETLTKFAADQGFYTYTDVPRAQGKQFFLGLRRDSGPHNGDTILLIAEKFVNEEKLHVDCNKIGNIPDFENIVSKLETAFRSKWSIVVERPKWPPSQ